ncbi:MAG: hypothetical protein U0R17_04430 [Acidimicrobiia bacterium]
MSSGAAANNSWAFQQQVMAQQAEAARISAWHAEALRNSHENAKWLLGAGRGAPGALQFTQWQIDAKRRIDQANAWQRRNCPMTYTQAQEDAWLNWHAANADAQRQIESRRVEAPRVEAARVEAARVEATRVEATRSAASRVEATRVEATRSAAARSAEVWDIITQLEAARIEADRKKAETFKTEWQSFTDVEKQYLTDLYDQRLAALRIQEERRQAESARIMRIQYAEWDKQARLRQVKAAERDAAKQRIFQAEHQLYVRKIEQAYLRNARGVILPVLDEASIAIRSGDRIELRKVLRKIDYLLDPRFHPHGKVVTGRNGFPILEIGEIDPEFQSTLVKSLGKVKTSNVPGFLSPDFYGQRAFRRILGNREGATLAPTIPGYEINPLQTKLGFYPTLFAFGDFSHTLPDNLAPNQLKSKLEEASKLVQIEIDKRPPNGLVETILDWEITTDNWLDADFGRAGGKNTRPSVVFAPPIELQR